VQSASYDQPLITCPDNEAKLFRYVPWPRGSVDPATELDAAVGDCSRHRYLHAPSMVRDRPRAGFIRVFYRLYRAALRHQDRCQRSHLAGSALGPTGESVLESISATRDPHHGRCSDTGTRRTGGQPTSAGTRSRSRVVPFGPQPQGGSFFATGCCNYRLQSSRKRRIG